MTALRDGQVLLNGGAVILDQLGSVIRNRTGRKDPGILVAPSQLRVGMRWRSDFYNQPDSPGAPLSKNFYDYRVRGIEELELPIGRMRTFHIVGEGMAVQTNSSSRLFSEVWIEPATMWSVKQIYRRLPQGSRNPDIHDTTIMVARSRVPR